MIDVVVEKRPANGTGISGGPVNGLAIVGSSARSGMFLTFLKFAAPVLPFTKHKLLLPLFGVKFFLVPAPSPVPGRLRLHPAGRKKSITGAADQRSVAVNHFSDFIYFRGWDAVFLCHVLEFAAGVKQGQEKNNEIFSLTALGHSASIRKT
jgi:hypothetical protein